MVRCAAVAVVFLTLVSVCAAQAPILPSRDLSAEDVISIQLKALSDAENNPDTNSGIRRVWAFAHPSNRLLTGPLARFTLMLQSPNYRPLIAHKAHRMREVEIAAAKARYAVEVTSSDGVVLGYVWELEKVSGGEFDGMWMTTSVVLVGKLGQSL